MITPPVHMSSEATQYMAQLLYETAYIDANPFAGLPVATQRLWIDKAEPHTRAVMSLLETAPWVLGMIEENERLKQAMKGRCYVE